MSTKTNSCITIGVAGGTGSGKTTIAREILTALGEENITYLVHDDYYKDLSHLSLEERAEQNFDHPDSLETSLLISHVKELRAGRCVREVPRYDFGTHTRCCRRTTVAVVAVEPKKIVLVEGVLIFADPALVELFDVKVFVDTAADIRLSRRLMRDVKERGRTMEGGLTQYTKTVRPMHDQFVEPSKEMADMILPCSKKNQTGVRMIVNHLKMEAGLLP